MDSKLRPGPVLDMLLLEKILGVNINDNVPLSVPRFSNDLNLAYDMSIDEVTPDKIEFRYFNYGDPVECTFYFTVGKVKEIVSCGANPAHAMCLNILKFKGVKIR